MKKILIFILLTLLLSSFVIGATLITDKTTTDTIFTELKENNPSIREAVFTFDNPKLTEQPKENLIISFNEVCGEVIDYELLEYKTISYDVETPIYKDTEICEDIEDNKTLEINKICTTEKTLIGYTTETKYKTDYYPVESLTTQSKDYKIKVNKIKYEDCGDGWGYKIDWIPYFIDGDTQYAKEEWAWFNETWLSRYVINYTCNYENDCINEWIALNYSEFSDCDEDLRVIYQNTTEILYEINDTDKMLYFFVNGTYNEMTQDYNIYCDNDGVSDNSNANVMLGFTDCEDTRGWVASGTGGAIYINDTINEVNKSGYGDVCAVRDMGAGGWGGAYFDLQQGATTGVVYGLYFANFKYTTPVANANFQAWSDVDDTYGFITWTNFEDWTQYNSGYEIIKSDILLDNWFITKQVMNVDTLKWDIWYNGVKILTNQDARGSTWGETITWFVAYQDTDAGSTFESRYDQIILSGYDVNLYPTKGTFEIGAYVEQNETEQNETEQNETTEINLLDCVYNSQPYIKFINKINWLCTLDTNTTNTTDYKCYSKIDVGGDTIQINPKQSEINDIGIIDYFQPQPADSQIQLVKVYFTTEDLKADIPVNFSVICAGEHKTLNFTREITPTYKDLNEVNTQTVWAKDNITYIIGGIFVIFILIALWVAFMGASK